MLKSVVGHRLKASRLVLQQEMWIYWFKEMGGKKEAEKADW